MFYDKLIYVCMLNNTNLKTLSEEIGINRSTISRWKTNFEDDDHRLPRPVTIKAISTYFSIKPIYFEDDSIEAEELPKYLIGTGSTVYPITTSKKLFELMNLMSRLSANQLGDVYRYVNSLLN